MCYFSDCNNVGTNEHGMCESCADVYYGEIYKMLTFNENNNE